MSDWLATNMKSPSFRQELAREDFVEGFLHIIKREMGRKGITNEELAIRTGISLANINELFARVIPLTAENMVDFAFHLDLRIKAIVFEQKEPT